MKCGNVQDRLVAYFGKEMGSAQSDLIRKHLSNCEDCKAAAREVAETLDILHKGAESLTSTPAHLSDEHRARITRSYRHPWIHWADTNHTLVSLIVAVVLLLIAIAGASLLRHETEAPDPAGGTEIWIDGGPPPEPEAPPDPPAP